MSASMLDIGVSGLSAAQLGLATTGNNIANVNTPGYSRETIVQVTQPGQFSGSGFVGNGTSVIGVSRAYDQFAVAQVNSLQSELSQSTTSAQQLAQITGALGNETQGVGASLTGFFTALQNLAASPGDTAVRSTVLSSAGALVQTMQSVDQQLTGFRTAINSDIQSITSEINSDASQIAKLNTQIVLATNSGQSPNQLLDQRDQLVNQLSKDVQVSTTTSPDGALNLFLGSGQSLVVGGNAFTVSTRADPASPTDVQVVVGNGAGVNVAIPAANLGGGQLSALFAVRDGTLKDTQNALGRVATVVATQFNQQNQLGVDLNGNAGGALFTIGAPVVTPNTGNQGSGVIGAAVANPTALTGSDYQVQYTSAGQYQVTRLSDGTVSTYASLPQTVDGVTLSVSGAPAAGDSFVVRPTVAAVAGFGVATSDPTRIAAAGAVTSAASSANLGNATIGQPSVPGPTVNANLRQPVTITFTGANTFNVTGTGTGNPTAVAYASGGTISYNGWSLQISGTPAAGDTFTVGPNLTPAGDNRNVNALAALQNATLVNGQTLTNAYATVLGNAGAAQQAANVTQQSQQTELTAATQTVQSISGVNLDEEAANLITYQQSYQASAKYIQIASGLFQSLLNATGG